MTSPPLPTAVDAVAARGTRASAAARIMRYLPCFIAETSNGAQIDDDLVELGVVLRMVFRERDQALVELVEQPLQLFDAGFVERQDQRRGAPPLDGVGLDAALGDFQGLQ